MSSDIQWLADPDGTKGFSWNTLTGCTPRSSGCLHCYAAALASRQMSPAHVGLTFKKKRRNAAGKLVSLPVFNGTVKLHPERLLLPMRKKKPRRIFVNSMSDLFHERVPFPFIAANFAVMAAARWHTFLILTKRPDIALLFFEWLGNENVLFELKRYALDHSLHGIEPGHACAWPLPNVQLGVSAEDQKTFDERTSFLRKLPSATPWVSYEPALDGIDASGALDFLRWLVVGGEAGPAARPFDVDWASTVVQQCQARGVPAFVKQLGSRPVRRGRAVVLADASGGDMQEWTGDLAPLAVRQLAA